MVSTRREIHPVFLFCYCLLAIQVSSLDHSATFKSYDKLRSECAQYLINGGECSGRCLALAGHSWDDCIGKTNVSISRFYRPDRCDHDNVNRTLKCMRKRVDALPLTKSCERAAASLRCYDDQFGHLIKQQPLYVPKTPMQATQLLLDCSAVLQIPGKKLLYIVQNGYLSAREGPCLARCLLIRAGLYSDDQGPNIDRFSIQCDGYGDEYEQFATRCFDKLRSMKLDKCTLAARAFDDCIVSNKYGNGGLISVIWDGPLVDKRALSI